MNTLWNWPGSRWWRFDLHTHSPASHDFKPPEDRAAKNWQKWVEAVRRAGIHAVAVTDHNTSAGIAGLQQAAAAVSDSPLIFPGVEVTASCGTHLLFVFDPRCNASHVDDLLSKVSIPVDQRGRSEARSTLSVEQLLDLQGSDVLVLGAHVNGPDGLLSHNGQQRIKELRHPKLLAVEVDPDRDIDASWLDGSKVEVGRRVPQLWCSDSHDHSHAGARITWVKMTRPTLEGLRLALLDGADSLKPKRMGEPPDPNTHADQVIERITVHKAKHMGRSADLVVDFNPWLSALIGGRGTGKSTLVDLCRVALRRESELGESEQSALRRALDHRMRVPSGREDEGLLTESTLVEVIYRKDGERFVLSWDAQGRAAAISRLGDTQPAPEQGDVRERFPVRIYSQKQLFDLATEPNALLTVIDDHQDVKGSDLARQLEQMRSKYLVQCAQHRALRLQAANLPARAAALVDVQRKLELFQRSGHAQTLNDYRVRQRQDGTWQSVRQAASDGVAAVARAAEDLGVADLDGSTTTGEADATQALARAHAASRGIVAALRQRVLDAVREADAELDAVRNGADLAVWRAAVAESEAAYQQVTERLSGAGITNPDQYRDLIQEVTTIEREIASLEQGRQEAEAREREALATLRDYRALRRVLTERRRTFVAKSQSPMIRVSIDEEAAREGLREEIQNALGIARFEDDYEALLSQLPTLQEPWSFERLDALTKTLREVVADPDQHLQTRDRRFESALRKLPPERLDRLALYLPDDRVKVEYQDQGSGKNPWLPLGQGSPGQKTAALLAFVLGYGDEPIILDQPEDDLDNTLIYELVVRRLRETKVTRQVIVVTHNPNIVVHGDAELVVSLEARNGETHIGCAGGLQEQKVRDQICRVMEGGRDAFERRFRRIMQPGAQRYE